MAYFGQVRLYPKTGGVQGFTASADTDAARGDALAAARAAAVTGDTIEVGPGNYSLSSGLTMLDNMRFILSGSVITATSAITLFTADRVDNWSLEGNGRLLGTGSGTETAIHVTKGTTNGHRWCINGLEITNWNTNGIRLGQTGTASSLYRGGRITGCLVDTCRTGILIDAVSEYHDISDTTVRASASVGVDVTGGNVNATNVSINGCGGQGLVFRSGTNHAHGNWSNCRFNHNTGNSVHFNGVTNGQTLSNCNVYGTSSTGAVAFTACQGCQWLGGIFSAPIVMAGTMPGMNYIRNVYSDSSGTRVMTATDERRAKLRIEGLFDLNGPISRTSTSSYGNDPIEIQIVTAAARDAMAASAVGSFIRNSDSSNRLEYNDAGTWKIVDLTAI